jgi:hypothetical protein
MDGRAGDFVGPDPDNYQDHPDKFSVLGFQSEMLNIFDIIIN